ncbi:hypothetical protein [Natrinema salifodinae]|uniref:SPW repeat-containing protein n=1 Tax=Natrinema salifodinae TaxID=1202768 RepID=A0A1I0MBZ9_9EURY|nr:hypothetical protein [Natrinema salifodinae]SEV86015.1 hypothetical protein SAMN05216285_0789 [Natrinema salifodinae]
MSDYDGTENPDTPWHSGDDGASEHDGRGDEDLTGRDRLPYEPNPDERGKRLSAAVGLVGLVLLGQAALVDLAAGQFWNDALVGATLLAAGGYNYYRRANAEFGSLGVAVLVALVGLWLVAAPFLLGAGSATAGGAETTSAVGFWTDIVAGLVAFGLGTYSAYAIRNRRRSAIPRRTAT